MSTPYPLGRHVQHDPRSKAFAVMVPTAAPRSVQWATTAPVLDQGELGSCTGNAMAQWANMTVYAKLRKHVNNGRHLTERDAVTLYSKATHLDNLSGYYPPDDTGSSGLAVAKAARALGYVDTYRHCFTWQQFLTAISGQPVIVGTTWTEQMFYPEAGWVTVGDINNMTRVGGHEYLCRGIDLSTQTLRFRNSWGPQWGRHGDFYMTFDDFRKLLADKGDVTVPHGAGLP